jgi:signal transduction histidine kinase/CheY-like chemotaxis protein
MTQATDLFHGRQQASRTVAVFGAFVIVAMMVSVVISLVAMRDRDIEDWRRQMSSMSLILADQTSQTVFAAYLILDSVAERVRDAGIADQASFRSTLSTVAMHEMLRDRIRGLPQVDVASIVAANGDNINFTRSFPVPPINLAERDYFKAHLENPRLGDFISQPVHNKGNGKWTFYISRRLNDAQGNFMGLILVGMSVDGFTRFFERIVHNLGEGASISLFRDDLMLLTRWPNKDDVIGTFNRSGASYEVVEVMKKKDDVLLRDTPRFSTGTSELRLTAVRRLDRYPLVLAIVVTEDIILSRWRSLVGLFAVITLAGVMAMVFGLLSLVRNLRLRESNMLQMRRLKTEAESANTAKSRFLATMSHEIRTPINGILGMAQLLLMPRLNENERQNYARTILASGQALLTLLNDILDLAKIEAEKIQLETLVFEPRQLFSEMQTLFSGLAVGKEIRFECQWRGPEGQCYGADSHRLRQMLSNLVSNAIKFTAQGTVRIEASEVERAGDTVLLEFSVQDTGLGISAEKLSSLFLPFVQADSSTTREFGGTGLGLSIVHNLARLMGGEVGAESEPGRGSRFWFRIRASLAQASEINLDPPLAGGLEARMEPLHGRILVVEDNPINRKVVEALLGKLGLSVVVANDGQQAVDMIRGGEEPDIVLMDVQMPVMDGFEATRRIRAWEKASGRTHWLPIVAMTASAYETDRRQCIDAGMNEFLSKPYNFEDLGALLRRLLTAAGSEPAGDQTPNSG